MLHIPINETDIVLVILSGFENWYLMSREECRLRVCESRVVRRIFVVGGEVGIERCRRFCSELDDFYCSIDIIIIIVARNTIYTGCFTNLGHNCRR